MPRGWAQWEIHKILALMLKVSQSKNKEGLRAFFEHFHARTYNFLKKHIIDAGQARDLAVDVLQSTWQKATASQRANPASLEQLLFARSKKAVLDQYRRKITERSNFDFVTQQVRNNDYRHNSSDLPGSTDNSEPREEVQQAVP